MVNTSYLAKNKSGGAQTVDMRSLFSLSTGKKNMIREVEIFSFHLMGIQCRAQLLGEETCIRKKLLKEAHSQTSK